MELSNYLTRTLNNAARCAMLLRCLQHSAYCPNSTALAGCASSRTQTQYSQSTCRRKSRKRFKKRKLFESFEPEALPGYSSAGGYASAEPDYASAGYGGPRGGEAAVPLGSHCVQHGRCACIRSTMNTYSASPSSGGCAYLCCAALAGMHPSLHDAATVEVTQASYATLTLLPCTPCLYCRVGRGTRRSTGHISRRRSGHICAVCQVSVLAFAADAWHALYPMRARTHIALCEGWAGKRCKCPRGGA